MIKIIIGSIGLFGAIWVVPYVIGLNIAPSTKGSTVITGIIIAILSICFVVGGLVDREVL